MDRSEVELPITADSTRGFGGCTPQSHTKTFDVGFGHAGSIDHAMQVKTTTLGVGRQFKDERIGEALKTCL